MLSENDRNYLASVDAIADELYINRNNVLFCLEDRGKVELKMLFLIPPIENAILK
ncbi:MAG: hypothetical protein PWQ93_116 [Clostridiales bacterium]|nr:hypothetical protein [Clostridiales bacterium]